MGQLLHPISFTEEAGCVQSQQHLTLALALCILAPKSSYFFHRHAANLVAISNLW